jgi:hypothetical protein
MLLLNFSAPALEATAVLDIPSGLHLVVTQLAG